VNRIHQLLVYFGVNSSDVNVRTTKKNTEVIMKATKKVGLEVKAEKIKRMLNARQKLKIKLANRSFENAANFKCLGTTVTNRNLIQEDIKTELDSGNAYYHSVSNLLPIRLFFKM
jgi:hypothetical protein